MQSSLRRHLSYWLLGPLLLLVAAGTFVSYRIALSAANKAYDSSLLDPVLAIASHLKRNGTRLELDLPSIAIEALRRHPRIGPLLGPGIGGGRVIAGTARLPAPPERLIPGEHIYYDATLEGERVRVAARAVTVDNGGTAIVQVAETLIKRDKLVLELLVASAVPQVLIAIAAVTLLWFGIGLGLRPLHRLRDEIVARSPRDLRPFSERDKPQEVRSLVDALNQLLSRLNAAIASQQRFIANAAHQLRTPLAGLKTHAELARRERSTSELRSLLDMIAVRPSARATRRGHLLPRQPGARRTTHRLHEIVGRDVRD
jgi:two-component system sensor histidine kinase TctE